jgi:hypothetical protein
VLWLAYIRDDEEEAGGADQIIRLCVSGGELQRFGGGVDDLQGLPVELDEVAEIDGKH